MKSNILIIGFFFCLITACEKTETPAPTPPTIDVENVQQIADMNNVLAWQLFREEQKSKQGENVLLSPWSIQTALQMALNGAKDNTLNEILTFLDCKDCDVESINAKQRDLTVLLEELAGHTELTSVNAFFYDNKRMTVKSDFTDALSKYYACGTENLDFDAENQSLDAINTFVKNGTKGKIDKILNNINPLDVAFLINALHFKADWSIAFAPEMTYSRDFINADGTTQTLDFVNGDRDFLTFDKPDFRGVDLPLRDSTYSVTLIQAGSNNQNPNWSQALNTETWKAFYMDLTADRAIVSFPKLKMSYENDLIASLKNVGVQAPFSSGEANFTDLGSGSLGNIFISQLKHKAVFEMDEKGVEGAAVTSIGFAQTSLPPVFTFDNPFVLLVRHVETNTILFVAYVAEAGE